MRIKEVIVVEGKDDTTAIKRSVDADTIETNGSAISKETLMKIQHAQEKRGVIVFTDPDYPGRRIRAIIEEHVPGVKHAFLSKEKTIAKNGKGLGIEHAKDEDIRQCARKCVYSENRKQTRTTEIPIKMLVEAKLIGSSKFKGPKNEAWRIIENRLYEWKTVTKTTFHFSN